MLNVGSNYISFSNYSPDYGARCGQSTTRPQRRRRRRAVRGGGRRRRVPSTRRAGRGQPRARARSPPPRLPSPALRPPAARRDGAAGRRGRQAGGGSGERSEESQAFSARPCKPKQKKVRHRLQTEDGSPRPSSGALRITARPPPLSLPGCTWPPAQGSSSPARSRHAGSAGGNCFGPSCSIPPPWGWGKAKCHSLLENKGAGERELEAETGIRSWIWLCFGMETAPCPHGRQSVGQC